MKILYSIQATGNGHISRAIQLVPELLKHHSVDVLLSGQNSHLKFPFPVRYRLDGISLFYNRSGGLSYKQILFNNYWSRAYKSAQSLPVDQYDLILNDFEPITALACKLRNKYSIQLSHQASFRFPETPRPLTQSALGEFVLSQYSSSTDYIGFHFKEYNPNILPPIIKKEILQATPIDKGHIVIYLSGFTPEFYINQLSKVKEIIFHCFVSGIHHPYKAGNILFKPIDYKEFTTSMIECHGIITGGGFETPSEALYLGKKLMVIPIQSHYEQSCNATALENMGIKIIRGNKVKKFNNCIKDWISVSTQTPTIKNSGLETTIGKVFETYESFQYQHLGLQSYS